MKSLTLNCSVKETVEFQDASIATLSQVGMHSFFEWKSVDEKIIAITRVRAAEWEAVGGVAPTQDVISSAWNLAHALRQAGDPAPRHVYPLPDGNLMFEWHLHDGIICRIELEGANKGQQMLSFPDKPAEFREVSWAGTAGPGWQGSIDGPALSPRLKGARRRARESGANESYQLAA